MRKVRRNISLTGCLMSLVLTMTLSIYATNVNEISQIDDIHHNSNKPDLFANMTDEEFRLYNDSLYNAIYPAAHLCVADTNAIDSSFADDVIKTISDIASSVPESVDIDRNKEVGQIPIISGTNQFGAKTYEVPIDVFPGNHGMTPEISLSYNSLAGNSFLGQGWTLSGIPAINREAQTVYYTGVTVPVTMDLEDMFSLDGVKLLRKDMYWEGNEHIVIYESEYGNIAAKGHFRNPHMIYFEVFYPDGRKAIFGDRYNSVNKLTYPITEIVDLYDNKITYHYTRPYGIDRIETISYNGASVKFGYSDREDILLSFRDGEKLQKKTLLTSVECLLGWTVLRTYKLTYTKPHQVSLLTQIDYEANGGSLNPIKFYYGEGITSSSMTTDNTQLVEWYETSGNNNAVIMARGKFDYNVGDDGIACYPNKNPYWLVHRHADKVMENRFENKYDGTEKILLYTGLSGSTANPMPNITTGEGFVDLVCADIHGNQEENIIKINNTVTGGRDVVEFSIYGNLMGSYVRLLSRTFDFGDAYEDDYHNWSVHPKYYYTGDFNGDGRTDIMAVSAHQPFNLDDNYEKGEHPTTVHVFDLLDNKLLYKGEMLKYHVDFPGTWQNDPAAAANNTDMIFVMDCDGDGKSEVCHVNAEGTDVYTFATQKEGGIKYVTKTSLLALKRTDLIDNKLLVGDFNGDGLTDIVVSPEVGKSSLWYVHCSAGDGHFERYSFSGVLRSEGDEFIAQDINGDGISDIVRLHDGYLYSYLFSNDVTRKSEGYGYVNKGSMLIPVDINAHSQSARILAIDKGVVTKYSFPRNDRKESLLTGMANSLGIVEKNNYAFINSDGISSGTYTPSAEAVFPFVNLIEAIPAIVSVQSYMNGSIVEKTMFEYENAVFHRQGRGFRGFSCIFTTDLRGHTTTRTYDVYGHSMLTGEKSPTFNNTYTYDEDVDDNKVARISLKSKQEKDLLKGITISTSIISDEFGFPVETTSSYTGGITIKETVKYAHSSEIKDGYNLGFEETIERTTTRDESTYIEKTYVNGISNRQPRVIYRYIDGGLARRDMFSYDSCGNVKEHIVLPLGCYLRDIAYNYEYDEYGRVICESDHIGSKWKISYDSRGNISQVLIRRGMGAKYTYDGLDRLIKTEYQDETSDQISYEWTSQGENGLYSLTNKSVSKPSTIQVFDALGRSVRESDVRFDGSVRNTDKTYDAYGNLLKVSLPFTGTSALYWNTYSYDSYDRVLAYNEASGRKTTYSYSGMSETTVVDNVSTKRTKDALGNLISCTDPGGTVVYKLAGDGQPISITAPGNVVTTFKYNKVRLKTEVNDPSGGATTYSYDRYGNLSKEINAKGDTITYTYDKYCKMTGKSCPEFTVSYIYDYFGNLVRVNSDNGSSTIYAYDDCGRVKAITEYAKEKIKVQRNFNFEDGNVSQIIYTTPRNGTLIEDRTYSNGHLVDIKVNSTTGIFTLKKENTLGLPTEVVTGPITREYGYSAYGFPTRRKASSNTSVIQDFSYEFDPISGNLKSRTDNMRSKKETFSYDGLNRLVSYGNETMTYDSKGNITTKSDVGSYSYGLSDKPYILTAIPSSSDLVSSKEQTVEYTSFGRPLTIKEGSSCFEFDYNADLERIIRVSKGITAYTPTDYYLGGFYHGSTTPFADVISTSTISTASVESPSILGECIYLGGDYYDAPAVFVNSATIGYSDTYYILRDYLGSITHLVKSSGVLKQELSYDAWGMFRDPDTHEVPTLGSATVPFLGRGYAGHEHWASLRLINMNARLYDPAVGRFLSPDALVQMPDMTQNFNRYAYCLNNPLRYVDEDGEFFWAVVGVAALIGGVTNVCSNWKDISNTGGWRGFWKGLGYFTVGGIAGGAGAAAGICSVVGLSGISTLTAASLATASSGALAGFTIGGTTGFVNGFLLNTSNSLLQGNSLGNSLSKGIYGGAMEGLTGGVLGGLSAGIEAVANHQNFFTGEVNKNFHTNSSQLLNEIENLPSVEPANRSPQYNGYYGMDENEAVRYVGTTTRDPAVRFNEHLRKSSQHSLLKYKSVESFSSRIEMRIWEQNNINTFKLMKNGGQLINKRNEIASKYWGLYGIKP